MVVQKFIIELFLRACYFYMIFCNIRPLLNISPRFYWRIHLLLDEYFYHLEHMVRAHQAEYKQNATSLLNSPRNYSLFSAKKVKKSDSILFQMLRKLSEL